MSVQYDGEAVSNVPLWTFGDRIRKARTVSGMNQADFSAAIAVAEGSLAAWETDRSKPRDIVGVAKRVELLTRIPATWLLDLPSTPPGQPIDQTVEAYNAA